MNECCDWSTDGLMKCGRRARWLVVRESEPGRRRYVCGIHARSVRRWRYGELAPIDEVDR